jgi:septum site-determining protein MinC
MALRCKIACGTNVRKRMAPFELRGGSFATMVLRVRDPDDATFVALLENKLAQAPGFFQNAPLVLDFDELTDPGRFSLDPLLEMLRQHRLSPVAIQGGSEEIHRLASAAQLAIMPAKAGERSSGPAAKTGTNTRVIREPVRSGTRIYVAQGDLVVLAPVSPGAELLADGNIHVYGALRGRALAGLNGDTSAHIFCQNLQAELVSIAGLYKVSEAFDVSLHKKNVHIYLDGDSLKMDVLPH